MKNRINLKKVLVTLVGILLIGTAVAFNAGASLGNDPVGIFYDGIRCLLNLEPAQLGTASNVVNILLILLLLVIGRHYVNLGTVIYIIPYGFCVTIGSNLYSMIFTSEALMVRIFASALGCTLLCLGVAVFIVADIGLDPMTGVTMVLKEKLGWDYKKAKWLFDGTLTTIGFLCGGKFGVITVITFLVCGPIIQWMTAKVGALLSGVLE